MATDLQVLLEIKQNILVQLILSFAEQAGEEYFSKYREVYLKGDFISDVANIMKNDKALRKEIEKLNLDKVKFLEQKFYDKMLKIGMNLPKTLSDRIENLNIKKEINNVCIVTNGTIMDNLHPENYYLASNGKFDSFEATRDFARMLGDNPDKARFLKWNGHDGKDDIDNGAINIARELTSYSKKNKDKFNHFDLVGHSHGGNVMIQVANKLYREGIKVDKVVCLNTPAREYTFYSPDTKLISIFTPKDEVMSFGNIDLYDTLIKLRKSSSPDKIEFSFNVPFPSGPKKGHDLPGAELHDITDYITEKEWASYKNMETTGFCPYPYHQFTRILTFDQRIWAKEGLSK
jgi:hypothetical protein